MGNVVAIRDYGQKAGDNRNLKSGLIEDELCRGMLREMQVRSAPKEEE